MHICVANNQVSLVTMPSKDPSCINHWGTPARRRSRSSRATSCTRVSGATVTRSLDIRSCTFNGHHHFLVRHPTCGDASAPIRHSGTLEALTSVASTACMAAITCRMASGKYRNRSPATIPRSPKRGRARSAARPWQYTAARAASNGLTPPARNAAVHPVKTSPVPAVASKAFPVGLTVSSPVGDAMTVGAPLSTTTWFHSTANRTAIAQRSCSIWSAHSPVSRAISPDMWCEHQRKACLRSPSLG